LLLEQNKACRTAPSKQSGVLKNFQNTTKAEATEGTHGFRWTKSKTDCNLVAALLAELEEQGLKQGLDKYAQVRRVAIANQRGKTAQQIKTQSKTSNLVCLQGAPRGRPPVHLPVEHICKQRLTHAGTTNGVKKNMRYPVNTS